MHQGTLFAEVQRAGLRGTRVPPDDPTPVKWLFTLAVEDAGTVVLLPRCLVVIERHRKGGDGFGVLRRQRFNRVGAEDGVEGGSVERVDVRGAGDNDVGDASVLMDVEPNDDAAAKSHGRL